MAFLEELKARRGEIVDKLKEFEKILKEHESLQEEMSSIERILNVYQERGELPRESNLTLPAAFAPKRFTHGKRLAPGVATEAFYVLKEAQTPLTIRDVHEAILRRGKIACNQGSVGMAMRRDPEHFKQVDRLRWKAIDT